MKYVNAKALQAVMEARLRPTEKLVLLLIASHADEDGVSWPSHARLSNLTGLSKRSVIRAVASLEAQGYLVVDRATGGRTSNRYQLTFRSDIESPLGGARGDRVSPLNGEGCQGVTTEVTESHPRGDRVSPEVNIEVNIEEPPPPTPPRPKENAGVEQEKKETPREPLATRLRSRLPESLGEVGVLIAAKLGRRWLDYRVPGRDEVALERLEAWEGDWTREEVEAAWKQARRDAQKSPRSLFLLILDAQVPLDRGLVGGVKRREALANDLAWLTEVE